MLIIECNWNVDYIYLQGNALCKECFFHAFEEEIHHTIVNAELFKCNETIAIGASGGKDSTVLAYILKHLNEKYNYGLKLVLLSIDEGITGCLTIVLLFIFLMRQR